MSEWRHICESGGETFQSEADAYEFLGRKFCFLFGSLPRNSHVDILLRSHPKVVRDSPFEGDEPEFRASFRMSVKTHG